MRFFKILIILIYLSVQLSKAKDDLNLKGFTYFDSISQYSYFYDNSYLLSTFSLQDVLSSKSFKFYEDLILIMLFIETKINSSYWNRGHFNFYTAEQINYFGSYLNETSVFYDNNIIYGLKFEENEIKLEEIHNFNKQLNDQKKVNYFKNVTGLISYKNMTIIFYQRDYKVYETEHEFTTSFFSDNLKRLNMISGFFNRNDNFIEELKLKSVNFIKNEFVFRFKKSDKEEVVVLSKRHNYDSQSKNLTLLIDRNYFINLEDCLTDSIFSREYDAINLPSFDYDNILVVFLVSISLGAFLVPIFVSIKKSPIDKNCDRKLENKNEKNQNKSKHEKSNASLNSSIKKVSSKNTVKRSSLSQPLTRPESYTDKKPKEPVEISNLDQALYFHHLISEPKCFIICKCSILFLVKLFI